MVKNPASSIGASLDVNAVASSPLHVFTESNLSRQDWTLCRDAFKEKDCTEVESYAQKIKGGGGEKTSESFKPPFLLLCLVDKSRHNV